MLCVARASLYDSVALSSASLFRLLPTPSLLVQPLHIRFLNCAALRLFSGFIVLPHLLRLPDVRVYGTMQYSLL